MRKSKAGARSGRATPGVTVAGKEDLAMAKEDALLQLKIGRSTHLYAVGISAALALDGMLVLFLFPHLPALPGGATRLAALGPTFFLLIPALAGLAIAAVGLYSKWEAFQMWPWEPHFSTTVAAVGLNLVLTIVYVLRIAGAAPFAHTALFPWFFPLELAGISLAFLGLSMTWNEWTGQQWAGTVTALLPLLTPLLIYERPTSTSTEADAIAVALLVSAIFYQMSGSFLHLLSSGTGPHESALIASGQSRIVRLADETRQKEEALRFREATLVRREADVETAESGLRRQELQMAEARKELDGRAARDRARSEDLDRKDRELAGKIAEVEGSERTIAGRVKAVELREQEIARQLPQIAAREQRVAQREGEQARRDTDISQRQQELKRRLDGAAETEARLEARRKQLDEKTADLLRREGDLAARGPAGGPRTTTATGGVGDAAQREARLQHLKTTLDEQNVVLGRRAREVAEREKAATDALRQATEKLALIAARETGVAQREASLADRLKAADDRRTQYEAAAREYQERLADFGRQQVDVAQRGAALDRSIQTVTDRESSLGEREKRLRGTLMELDQRERDLVARERAVEAHEAEVSLRRQAADRSGMTLAGLAAMANAERADAPISRGFGRASGARAARAEPAPAEEEATAPPSELLAPTSSRRYADRLPTGTPRLDDLLLGGMPARNHVVLLGDAFVGKEVVLYAFLAEGLKRGEPVVIVTASRSPTEVAQSLGVVLPQFLEYDQLGMVTWIDASTTGGVSGPRRFVTKGSDDRAGILSALVQAARPIEEEKKGPFRVGFLGLSAVFAHADERASFSFLQNVVGILKPREALAMYSLEGGALTEAQVESLLGRMDGAIVFRQDRDRTFLSVRGFGDVQTKDWVECRATNRALIVGSFALERIR
ncbi:MAG TPA: ATPase domain-containing protein [Thermoplasmata archaeon]|nr:ATPase domain-containing protein [Thermoplasmata archaeon]